MTDRAPADAKIEPVPTAKITPEETKAYADLHEAEWAFRARPGQQRLFYTAAQLRERIEAIQKDASPLAAAARKSLLEGADRVCASPIPVYQPPKPTADKASHASEEGWIAKVGDELVLLSVAAKLAPEKPYRQRIHDAVLAGIGYETWGRQGANGELANMDLAAGRMARGIAMAYDWNRDLFSDAEKEQIRAGMAEKVHCLLQGLYGAIFWTNWYSQNHNHVSVAGLGLAGAAFLDEIPEARIWLAGAMIDMDRAARALDPDGSSYEGVLYWGYGRAYILQFIEGIRPVADAEAFYAYPSMRNAAAFRIDSSVPGPGNVLPWADCRGFEATGPQHLLYRLAAQYGDGEAQYVADTFPLAPQAIDACAWMVLWRDPSVKAVKPTRLDSFIPSWNVVSTRSGWGDGDYLLSLKSGFNRNHHTQLDAGSLVFGMGGDWMLMTPGYGLGSGQKGFFDLAGPRWNFFSNATESHSALLVNGRNQRSDPEARGTIDHYVSAPSSLWTEADLSGVYLDTQRVRRCILHRRGKYALVLDEVGAAEPVVVEWLAQVPPRARAEKASLLVEGGKGRLRLRLLGENEPFAERKPTTAAVDVSPRRMITMASGKKGREVRFAALLEPLDATGGKDDPQWKTSFVPDADGASRTVIEGDGWKDTVSCAGREKTVRLDGPVTAEASFLAVAEVPSRPASVVAGGLRSLRTGPLDLASPAGVDLSLEAGADGAFFLDLGTRFKGRLALSGGYALTRENGDPADGSDLEPGRYLLLRDAGQAAGARRWAEGLFPDRKAPAFPAPAVAEGVPARQGGEVAWEAEEGFAARYDYVTVGDQPAVPSKKALVGFGIDSPTDSVGWKVKVPSSGTYALRMRYSVQQPAAHFALLVDGALAAPGAERASVPGPKAWASERYFVSTGFDWREETVRDASGRPLVFRLPAGEHEIRLASPTEPINFDSFRLVGAPLEK